MNLTRLREETRPAHEALEAHIDLLGRKWSPSFYQSLLQKFYGFYNRIEPPLFAHVEWEQVGIDVESRRKAALLVRDLKRLGLTEDAIENLPRCPDAPLPRTFPQALGCAYVLEGSTLGGQIITRHLKRELGSEAERGSAFFTSYGPNVGPMWRQFTAVLNTYPLGKTEHNNLVQSSRDTFGALDAWLRDIL